MMDKNYRSVVGGLIQVELKLIEPSVFQIQSLVLKRGFARYLIPNISNIRD